MMTRLPKVLVVGCKGQVGTETIRLLEQGGYNYVAVDREECDLTVRGNIGDLIRLVRPRFVVNAAAYTAVDHAETEQELARAINVDAPREIAEAAKEVEAVVIHYSTDYVFNGNNDRPWVETDTPSPLSVYGQTKLDGERAIAETGAAHFTFRTSWVYGSHGANFLLTMLKLGASREELSIVADQVGAPTWSRSLAELTMHTVRKFSSPSGEVELNSAFELSGIYHATCAGVTNWFEFASAIFEEARKHDIELAIRNVKPIRTDEYPTAARRPNYSVLSNEKLQQQLGFSMPDWREALTLVMSEVAAEREAAAEIAKSARGAHA